MLCSLEACADVDGRIRDAIVDRFDCKRWCRVPVQSKECNDCCWDEFEGYVLELFLEYEYTAGQKNELFVSTVLLWILYGEANFANPESVTLLIRGGQNYSMEFYNTSKTYANPQP